MWATAVLALGHPVRARVTSPNPGSLNRAPLVGRRVALLAEGAPGAGSNLGRAQPSDLRGDLDALVFRFKLFLELLEPSATSITEDAEAVDSDQSSPELRDEVPDSRVDAACSL